MKIIAEGECWSQKWSQDRGDTESVSEQQFCCASHNQIETLQTVRRKYSSGFKTPNISSYQHIYL